MSSKLALCLLLAACLAAAPALAAPRALLDRESKCQVGACPFMQQKPAKGKAPCRACPDGTYTPSAGACCTECEGILAVTATTATCSTCPAGSVLAKKGKSQPATCVCPEGTQSTGSDATFGVAGCSACPVGTFNQAKSTNATNACVPCRDNAIAAQPGASKCTPCTGNSTANALRTACECPAGTYLFTKSVGGRNKDRKTVIKCRSCDATSIIVITNGVASCSACPANSAPNDAKTACVCNAGFEAVTDLNSGAVSSCSACTDGTANPTAGGTCAPCMGNTATTDGISCGSCATGYFNSAAAGSAVATCTTCAASYFLDSSSSSCSACTDTNVNPDNNTWGACCANGWNANDAMCTP